MKKTSDVIMVPISHLLWDYLKFNPNRTLFEPLFASIKESGFLTEYPIEVLELKYGSITRYLIVDGHKRYKCALYLDIREVPIRIIYPESEMELLMAYC